MGAAVALWRLGLDAEARSNTLFLVARKPSLIAQLGRAVVKKENGQNNEEERCEGTGEGRRRREWAAKVGVGRALANAKGGAGLGGLGGLGFEGRECAGMHRRERRRRIRIRGLGSAKTRKARRV